ncbi:exonuclease, partial [Escherichia albertii]|nr:exonuclease [Escherichia albertii]
MSKVFICAAIPDEQATAEGAKPVATAIEAGDERRARAKFSWLFLEQYPEAQDCAYKFLVCEDKPGMARPALDSWDSEYMQENRWNEESASFVPVAPEPDTETVNFNQLSEDKRAAVLVRFGTHENITVDMVINASGLLGDDEMTTFDGHLTEAIIRTKEINAMYPERQTEYINDARRDLKPTAKWPDVQAYFLERKKRMEKERKEGGAYNSVVDLARARVNRQGTENSAGKTGSVTAVIRREYRQTWKTLDEELAYALWPGDV